MFYRTAPANATIHDAIRPLRPNPAENNCWNVEVVVGGGGLDTMLLSDPINMMLAHL